MLREELKNLKKFFEITKKEKELKELEKKAAEPDFWQKEKEAAKIQQKISQLKEEIEGIDGLEKELKDMEGLLAIIKEDSVEYGELAEDFKKLKKRIKGKIRENFLSGKYDKNSAIITIQAGAGGRDSEDWANLLLRMYQRWAERKNFPSKILYQRFGEGGGPEGRIGIKEVSLEVKGKYAYGLLKNEKGVHRLVRLSPFSSKNLRHTSFAGLEVLPVMTEGEAPEIVLKPEDLKIETFRSSGPGGQNVNRRETAVRITHLPSGLRSESQIERFQAANRKIALQMLVAKLLRLNEKEKEEEIKGIKGERIEMEFGSQIRSYIFHPYKLVKDHRTKIETSDVEGVLDGEIDQFIEAEIKL